ncbi:MAG: LPS-assembly protein LptD [Bacteroidales bacterium]|nr:LPS-assembly protein LptD [Bacteroidales bacterium]
MNNNLKKQKYINICYFVIFILVFFTAKISLAEPRNNDFFASDSVLFSENVTDTSATDSVQSVRRSKNGIKDRVTYFASDSVSFDLDSSKVYLYNNANVKQKQIDLSSGFITINFDSNSLWALPILDSAQNNSQFPVFKDGKDEYKSRELKYNFDSEKGLIYHMFTKEQEGYLHGEKIKKINDSTMYVSQGMFTTCDNEEDPHFGINFNKAEIKVQDKIITGVTWLSIADIPMPLALPFGYFPITSEQKSGLLMPTYGHATNRGYYLRNLGWYFAFNDYLDLAARGDIYTNLSYAIDLSSNYVKRYRYKGKIQLRLEENHSGIKNTSSWASQRDFKLQWTHTQDAKAHPYRTFSANVNLVSSSYNQYTTSVSDYMTNTTTSSVAFSTRFGPNWSFSANLGENYNANTKYISLDLPSIALSSAQFHPFKRKKASGKTRWYEEITIAYRMNLINQIQTYDSLLFKGDWYNKMNNGIKHYIPIQHSTKVLKYLNWTNSVSYNERWYLKSAHKAYNSQTDRIDKDTVYGFIANRDISFSSGLNTRIYGMFSFKKGYVKAVRHVFNPVISFNFTPDFSDPSLGFYDFYVDKEGKKVYYSKTEDGVYGSPPGNKSGVISLALNNSLEMKVKNSSDSITGTKKIKLLENFSLSSGYDLAKDSCNWQPLRLTARTTLFERIVVNYSASYTPYVLDENNRITDEFLWERHKKLFQKQSSQWNLSLSWHLNKRSSGNNSDIKEKASPTELAYSPFINNNEILPDVVDFSIPWDLTVSANYSRLSTYIVAIAGYETNKAATLSVYGNVNATDKWKVGFNTGYDFINKDYTYTSLDFYRDLHCWELRMNWIPFGPRQGWNFGISVKASMLQDLKYEKRNDFRNRLTY